MTGVLSVFRLTGFWKLCDYLLDANACEAVMHRVDTLTASMLPKWPAQLQMIVIERLWKEISEEPLRDWLVWSFAWVLTPEMVESCGEQWPHDLLRALLLRKVKDCAGSIAQPS